MACGTQETLLFMMGLFTGTGSTLTTKILYEIESVGLDGELKRFEKPIFQTWLMFLAMTLALPLHWIYSWYTECKLGHTLQNKVECSTTAKTQFLLMVLAGFNLLAMFLANIGLMYVTASAFQLVKCTVIAFVALLKVFVLRDRLRGYMWIGIALNMLAALMVGVVNITDSKTNTGGSRAGFGILMVVLSCVVQATQYVFEEKLMRKEGGAPPLVVVGMEGIWGLILTSIVVYPIAYVIPGDDLGSYERFDDTSAMIQNSSLAQAVVALSFIMSLGFNSFSMLVTHRLNSIWSAILENFRPITVWATDLVMFYVCTSGQFGETWTSWSWLQIIGMIMLMVGTAIYNGTIELPGFVYLSKQASLQQSITSIEAHQYSDLSSPRESTYTENVEQDFESMVDGGM